MRWSDSVDVLSASPSASRPPQICSARRRAIIGTSEFFHSRPPAARLERLDVRSRRTLLALRHVEGDLLALLQRFVATALDRAVMREQILAAIVRGDESEALRIVEPLHGASCHVIPSLRLHEAVRAPLAGMMIKSRN